MKKRMLPADAYSDRRGTGRTTRMIEQLPATGSVVVVPHWPMARHIRDMIGMLRGGEVYARTRVIAVERPKDADYLRGLSIPVYLDHSFTELCRDAQVMAEVLELQRHINSRLALNTAKQDRHQDDHQDKA